MSEKGKEVLYVNGEFLPVDGRHVSGLDRGFTLGDGVFETMRAYRGGIFRLGDHLERLHAGAAALRLPVPLSDGELRQALRATLERNKLTEAILRLTISRGPSYQRGLLPEASVSPTVVIRAMPFVSFPESKYVSGFRVIISSIRRNETSPTVYIKSLNYLDNILGRMEAARAGADDAIRLNTRGHVTCGTTSNLFLVTTRSLVTPSIASGVLAGVTRKVVLEMARELGIRAEERLVSIRTLLASREVFLTSSVMGLMPVVQVDDHLIGTGQPGPAWSRLATAYQTALERYAERL